MFFFLIIPRPPSSTLFPYTTLFRSMLTELVEGLNRLLGKKIVGLYLSGSLAYGDFLDRKSTRLNSSHLGISYAVFCLKKKIESYIDCSIKYILFNSSTWDVHSFENL